MTENTVLPRFTYGDMYVEVVIGHFFPTRDETYNSHEIKGITYDVKDGGAPVLPAPETDSQKGGYETG